MTELRMRDSDNNNTRARTFTTGEPHAGIARNNSYIANGSSTVQLLGTTEASVACPGGALEICSIAARNRFGEQSLAIQTISKHHNFTENRHFNCTTWYHYEMINSWHIDKLQCSK